MTGIKLYIFVVSFSLPVVVFAAYFFLTLFIRPFFEWSFDRCPLGCGGGGDHKCSRVQSEDTPTAETTDTPPAPPLTMSKLTDHHRTTTETKTKHSSSDFFDLLLLLLL